jgi:glutathione S-transferase
MITLFGNLESGNVHKVQSILYRIEVAYRRVEVSQAAGHPRSEKFLALNPMGKVPALRLDNGDVITESGALLYWFGRGTELWPADERARTEVLRWMFFEQYSHEPALAVMRYLRSFAPPSEDNARRVRELTPRAHQALQVMNARLASSTFLAGDTCTLADLALHPYTHWSDQAGIDLTAYEHVRRWLARVEAEPRFLAPGIEGATEAVPFDDYFA